MMHPKIETIKTSKTIWRELDGILLLDKPLGLSSNQALQKVRRLFQAKKAGHTGSLDPLATGLLPICFGRFTKYTQKWLDSHKHYRVQCELGIQRLGGDREGDIIAQTEVPDYSLEFLNSVVKSFLGEQQQIPPMHSAIKHQGKPLYQLAREGKTIERTPRTIHIFKIDLLNYHPETHLLELDVHCSKGTYIRTLAEDLGDRLGCGAHVAALRRTGVEGFDSKNMYNWLQLEEQFHQEGLAGLERLLLKTI